MAGKKTGKRLLTWVLVLVMALSLLPVSALAADGTIVHGGVTLYTEKRPQRYTFLRSNGENAVTKNVGDTGFYQRLPRDTYVHTSCGTVLAEFIPDYYSASTTTVELSDPTVLKDLSWTISGWNGNDEYKDFPCLTFNFTAAKPGTTTVKLTFYYNYDHGGEIGYCNGCGDLVQYNANRYWWQETTTFTVTVTGEEEKPEYTLTYHENTTDPVTNMPDPKTVTLKSSTSPVTFTVSGNKPKRDDYTFLGWAGNSNATEPTVQPGNTITTPATTTNLYAVWQSNTPPTDKPAKPTENDVTGVVVDIVCVTTTGTHDMVQYPLGYPTDAQHTIGEVVSDGAGGYICPVTVRTAWFVQQASDLVRKVQHTKTASTITFNLTYDKNSETWVKPAANPRIEATHEVTPPEAPTADELKKLEMAEMAVLVKCDVDGAQQHTEAYGLLGEYNEDYIVGDPKKVGNDWLCDINYVPDPYVAEFNKTFPTLKHIQNDEKIDPVTLIWGGENWQIKTQGRVHVTEEYTVTFNAYGGFPMPDEQHVKSGEKAVLPAEPTLKGHTFAFWYLGDDEQNATAYDFNTPVTENITLTAKWNINKYTVTFNSYGGTPVPPAQEVEYGLTATEPATAPTKTGYTFDGWYLGDEKYDFSDAVEQNITLYANWEKNIYTVTYTDGVDGEEVFADQTYRVPFEDTTPAFKGNPTRDGYVFDGWKPAFSDTVTGNVTYVAQWTARTDLSYTVHYYLKGTTKKVADDKTVDGQTFNAVVKEEAIRISGYRVYGNSVKSITIGTGTNEIIFYYTRASRPSTPSKPTLNTGDHYAYVMGYPDGTVRPNGSITRAEVSTILFRLLSDKTRDEYFTTESSFTDVKAGAWYNNSIATLEKAGVIVDTAKGGAFRPNEAITRAELAAMLAQFSDAKPVKGVKFSDVSAEHWAYEAIAIAAKMGWIEGYPDGTFRPDATITRAEMMTLVNRALERVPSDEDHLLSKRVMLTFPDCKSGDWFYIAVQEATNSHTYERAATEKNGDEQWTALRANRDWTQLEK